MCCLAYENDTYAEAEKVMPKINSRVETKDGEGTVIFNNLLNQTVTVKFEKDNEVKTMEYKLDEIKKEKRNLKEKNK